MPLTSSLSKDHLISELIIISISKSPVGGIVTYCFARDIGYIIRGPPSILAAWNEVGRAYANISSSLLS